MEASESVLRAGYRLDRYELLCPIASGGMATVWLARLRGKRGFEKLFAVKTIRTELVDDARFQEMFLDEARIASGIQHPNVAQILDLGEQDDVLFIVMEWVDGDSLAKIRKLLSKQGTSLPMGLVLRVLADACAGLHAAHELRDNQGEPLEIVHRDVSPHNILLATSGAVKVIDFGIAKSQNRRQGQTRTGIVKGKIQYMAPEQVNKGASVDRRADVWALGMCLHELALGKLPYDGDDDVDVIRKLMGNEAPVIAPGAPPPIARILEQAMALDPDARFPTAAGMQRALEGAMKELGESASSEDVAAFLRAELPDLAKRRRDAVGRAIDDAKERGTPITESRDEVAFAPTVVGDRGARPSSADDARAIALTKRKRDVPRGPDDSNVTPSTALENEPITIPKRGRGLVWATLLAVGVGAGGVFLWHEVGGPMFIDPSTGRAPDPANGAVAPPRAPTLPPAPPRPALPLAPSVAPLAPAPSATSPGGAIARTPEPSATSSAAAPGIGAASPIPSAPAPAAGGARSPTEVFPPRPAAPEDGRSAPAASGHPLMPAAPSPPSEDLRAPESRLPSLAPSASAAPSAAPSAPEDDPNNPYNN